MIQSKSLFDESINSGITLFEYILKSMPRVNWAVAKNWLGDWAPEEYAKLYDYIEDGTPRNANPYEIEKIIGDSEDVLKDSDSEFK